MHGLSNKITLLRKLLAEFDSVVVCFSGGVDSSYLLAESILVLGDRATALTAISPSLAPEERSAVQQLAKRLGARHILVDTYEVDDPRYALNPVNRCYFCKTEVYGRAVAEARSLGAAHVVDGFNVDDRSDYRPGKQAAREQGVRSPLDEVGFKKTEIRAAARSLSLPVWNKPALACLSSRFPYGTQITPARLTQVAACERVLKDLGFPICRVRHHEKTARIEVEPSSIARLKQPDILSEVVRQFQSAGFEQIDVDPQGYRTGGLNLQRETSAPPE